MRRRKRTWRIAQVTVAGLRHRSLSVANDDAVQHAYLGRGAVVIAVADGAGSARLGGSGARIAVRAAVKAVRHRVDPGWGATRIGDCMPGLFQEVRDTLTRSAKRRSIEPRDLATTLMICVATKRSLIFGQIGDGALVVGTDPENLSLVPLARRGEFVGDTVFLTTTPCPSPLVAIERKRLVFAMMTDGVESLSIRTVGGVPAKGFFSPVFSALIHRGASPVVSQLKGLFESEAVTGRTDDDLTLVIGSKRTTRDLSR